MNRKNELSPTSKKIAEFIGLLIASALTLAIIIIIILGVAAWYKTLF